MKKYFFIIIALFGLTFSGCGTSTILPDEVCTYTEIICDYSDLVCQTFPESCTYVYIACLNLNALCDSSLTEAQRKLHLEVLKANNEAFQKYLKEVK